MKKKQVFIIIFIIILSIFFRKSIAKAYQKIDFLVSNVNNGLIAIKSGIYLKNKEISEKFYYSNKINDLLKENAKLKIENTEIKAKNNLLHKLEYENKILKKLLDMQNQDIDTYEVASVVLVDSLINNDYFYIDKGKLAGIEVGMPVVYETNLIGTIGYVSDKYAEVVLITNQKSKISVIINDKVLAVMRGNGNNTFSINKFHDEVQDIKTEEFNIKTSGISIKYPEGLEVGTFKTTKPEDYNNLHNLKFTPKYNVKDIANVMIYRKQIDNNIIKDIMERETNNNE